MKVNIDRLLICFFLSALFFAGANLMQDVMLNEGKISLHVK